VQDWIFVLIWMCGYNLFWIQWEWSSNSISLWSLNELWLKRGPWRLDLNQGKSLIFKEGRHALYVLVVFFERESIWVLDGFFKVSNIFPQPKTSPSPWKSTWAFTWVLGLQSGLILDWFGLRVIRFDFDFELEVSQIWPGHWLGSRLEL